MKRNNSGKLLIVKPDYNAWPIGYAYVLACLESNDIPFDFIDLARSPHRIKDVEIMLETNSYLAVASGGLIGFYGFFKQLADITHKHNPNMLFILGGNITKDSSDSFLFNKIGIDFGIIGEVETSLPGLINALNNRDDDFSKLPGVIYKNTNGDVNRNLSQRLDLRKNTILPAWHNYDVDYYIKSGSLPFVGDNIKFMPVLSGRGCIGKCSFCSPTIGGFRKRPIEHVIYEIIDISSKYEFDYIMFYNEMFYPTTKEIREFCRQYKSLTNRKPWITQVRIDSNIDIDTFVQMKEAGCILVGAGIESGSDRILKRMNKRITSNQIRRFFKNAKMANMPTCGTFILGYEGEKEEDIKKTIDLVIDEEINTDASLMYVYPGTDVYDNACKKGLIKDEMDHLEKVRKFSFFAPNSKGLFFNITNIPDDQFYDIATREVRRYNTFIFNRYPVQNLLCRLEKKNNKAIMIMTGKCHECGAKVSYDYNVFIGFEYIGLLGIGINDRRICPNCIKQLSFNIYTCPNMKELREYFFFLRERISKRNKIIIGGINQDAIFLLRINLLNLDYDKILGFVDFSEQYRGKFYVNYPMLNVDHIADLEPDCILLVDCVSDAQNILNKFYKKWNMPLPEILYLCDNHFREKLKKIRHEITYKSWNKKLVTSLMYRLKNKYLYLRKFCNESNIVLPGFIDKFAEYFRNRFFIR